MSVNISSPIPWRTVEDALHAWVTAVLAIDIAWQNQAEPQPAYPFAELNITGPMMIGMGDEKRVSEKTDAAGAGTDEWQSESRGQREIIVAVQLSVGGQAGKNPSAHARHLATQLIASLGLDSFSDDLSAAGLAFIDQVAPIVDTSFVVGSDYTDRKLLELRFGLASSVSEDIDVIEEVEVTGTVTNVDGSTLTVGPIDIDSTP